MKINCNGRETCNVQRRKREKQEYLERRKLEEIEEVSSIRFFLLVKVDTNHQIRTLEIIFCKYFLKQKLKLRGMIETLVKADFKFC